MTTIDGIFPRRRRDGDGCGDAAVPSDQRRRRLRQGQGMTQQEGGGRRRQGTRAVGGQRKAREWRVIENVFREVIKKGCLYLVM